MTRCAADEYCANNVCTKKDCENDNDCEDRVCDTGNYKCRECIDNTECSTKWGHKGLNYCSKEKKKCVECAMSTHCSHKPVDERFCIEGTC